MCSLYVLTESFRCVSILHQSYHNNMFHGSVSSPTENIIYNWFPMGGSSGCGSTHTSSRMHFPFQGHWKVEKFILPGRQEGKSATIAECLSSATPALNQSMMSNRPWLDNLPANDTQQIYWVSLASRLSMQDSMQAWHLSGTQRLYRTFLFVSQAG